MFRQRAVLGAREGRLCVLKFKDLYVNGSGSITSVGEEGANLSAFVYL